MRAARLPLGDAQAGGGDDRAELLELVDRFFEQCDRAIHGIPGPVALPEHIETEKIVQAIDYRKDVDGFNPINVGGW